MLAESNDAVRARQVAKEQLEAVEQVSIFKTIYFI